MSAVMLGRAFMLAAAVGTATTQVAPLRATSLFQFTADEFWLNLHHYLYVLGRAHNGADSGQPAVASAPDDERQGRAALSDADRTSWDEAVSAYASGLSRQSSVLQPPLAPMTVALATGGDTETFPVATFDASTRSILERAAPIYRKGWWPRHRSLNQQYERALKEMIDRDGAAIVAFVTRAYQMEWPQNPYPVHLVAYSNFQGAFSLTGGRVLIMSTNANPLNDRWYPLESAFHEAMHQWDNVVAAVLRTQAAASGVSVPQDFSHVLIFVTAGEAVRRLHPEHVPLMDAAGLWKLTLSGARMPAQRLKTPVMDIWKPYLDGHGTRDEVLRQLLVAAESAR
jgi:hypothetical protein